MSNSAITVIAMFGGMFICMVMILLAYFLSNLLSNKLKRKFEKMIKSLGKDDFTIINEVRAGNVKVYPENAEIHGDGIECVNKTLDLDGKMKIGIDVPSNSIDLYNDDFEWDVKTGVNTHLMISEEQYREYLDLIKDCNVVATQSFYLKIKLSNEDVIAQITKWNKYVTYYNVATEYEFERYNVLNLITDMKPFSDEEIDGLIDNIKERMIELMNMKLQLKTEE